jgi:hypothetical protein
MDELIGLLAEAAALSRHARAEAKRTEGRAVPQPQPPQKKVVLAAEKGGGKATAAQAPVAPAVARPLQAVRQPGHPAGLAAAFHDRSSLLTALVAVEVLGPPPSLRPRELRGDV